MAGSVNRRSVARRAAAAPMGPRLLCGLLALMLPLPAHADDQAMPGAPAAAASPLPGKADQASPEPAWAGDLMTRANLLGDIGGLRPLLDRTGLAFGLSETTEVLGNPTGGVKQGAIVEGLTQMSLSADLSKSIGLDGGTFTISGLQIHGRGLSATHLDNLNVVSGIEADPATRLNELWYQQSFWNGAFDIKIGQQSADLEFITSDYESLFINSGFGWPTLPAVDLPSGGPAYPLPTPGLRLRAKPNDSIVGLLGLFGGSPAGLRPGDPQKNDPSGTNFDVSSGAFLIGELQVLVNKDKDATGLPATYKLGAWYNSNRFADPFFSNAATATIVPPSAGGTGLAAAPAKRGDWSVYGVIDQLVYRPKDSDDGGLGLTARAMGAPGDRNLVDLFLQGGATYKGAFSRPNDTMGLGVEWARISPRAQSGDAFAALSTGTFVPLRSSETVIEATYQAQITPWWQVQSDFQYIVNPGGGLVDPNKPNRRIGDAAVLGLRSVITF